MKIKSLKEWGYGQSTTAMNRALNHALQKYRDQQEAQYSGFRMKLLHFLTVMLFALTIAVLGLVNYKLLMR